MIENKIQITTSMLALIALLKQQHNLIPKEIQKIGDNPTMCTDMELVQALQVASLPCYAGTKQSDLIKKMVGLTDDYRAIFTPYQTYILNTSALDWKNLNYSISSYIEEIQKFASTRPTDKKVCQIWEAFLNMIQSVSVCPKGDFGLNWMKILKILGIECQESKFEASIHNLFICYCRLQQVIPSLGNNTPCIFNKTYLNC